MKIAKKIDTRSLTFRLWLYMVIFALVIILIIWSAQIYMLNSSYERMRSKQIISIAENIVDDYTEAQELSLRDLAGTAAGNDLVIILEESGGQATMINQTGEASYFNWLIQQPMNTYTLERGRIRAALRENASRNYVTMTNKTNSEYRTLSYGTYLYYTPREEAILYLFASIYPVSGTISILKNMLISVTVFAVILALFLALFLSRRVTRPLNGIRKTAKRLSDGEYGIDFDAGHYTEINDLSETLTYTSHELAKTEQLQRDIIANVSHDLKTPLTMVKSYAEMIRDISGDNPQKRNAHLDVIIEETDRLNLLVNDMFTLSTMQSGVVEMKKDVFDLVSAASEIYASYAILEEDGYDLRFHAPEEAKIYADENRIKQVISNLMNNAAKYSGDDKFISMDISSENGMIILAVSDHGMGISDEDREHVWDRYYRASSNYHRSNRGTGLGLSIAKEILELHNAEYGVESEPGKGSSFWFSLPAADS